MAKPKLNLKALDGVENSYDERPTRPCMACGRNDKAPRSVTYLADGNAVLYHLDCAAMLGNETVQQELEALGTTAGTDGLKNEELWLAIVDKSDLNPGSETLEFFKSKDVSGGYQKALDNGEIQDTTWEGAL